MMGFYDMSEDERIFLTRQAAAQRRTLYERWRALGEEEAAPWSARAAQAATYLSGQRGVADLGCATMTLERYLDSDTQYFPIDVVKRDERTLVCDLNTSSPPATPASAVACLGLIEYLYEPQLLFEKLRRQYGLCVASYCISDAKHLTVSRQAHAWVNDYSRAEIESIFKSSSWTIADAHMIDDMQMMWKLI